MRDEVTIWFGADPHVGSAYGLFPRGFKNSAGNIVQLNEGQEYLDECFSHTEQVLPKRLTAAIPLGDLCEGNNPKDCSLGLSEVEPGKQEDAAALVFKGIFGRADELRFVRGSKYHTGSSGRSDENVAKKFKNSVKQGNLYCPIWRRVQYHGIILDIAHRQSISSVNHSMPMEREERKAKERSDGGVQGPVPDIIVRAHAHWGYGLWEDDRHAVITVPPFKLMDDFATSLPSPNSVFPQCIGSVLLTIYPEPWHGRRWHIYPILFKHPQVPIEQGGGNREGKTGPAEAAA